MVNATTTTGLPSSGRAAFWTPKFTDGGVQIDMSSDPKLDALMAPVLVEVIDHCQDFGKLPCRCESIEQEETSKLFDEIMAYT